MMWQAKSSRITGIGTPTSQSSIPLPMTPSTVA